MKPIEYLKLQAKNLHKDFKTKKPYLERMTGDYFYEYEPKFFNVDAILISFDIDQDNFKLMNAQHIIARLVGYEKWPAMLTASPEALELSKLLFDNMHKICIEEWEDYIGRTEYENDMVFNDGTRLDIFKTVFAEVDGHESFRMDYRLFKNEKHSDEGRAVKPKKKKKKTAVQISSLPLTGEDHKEFIRVANEKFEDILQTIEPNHPRLVRKLWNPDQYIDKVIKPNMLPIARDYALSIVEAFLIHHVIELAVETD